MTERARSTEGRLSSVGALRPSSEFCMRCSDLEALPFHIGVFWLGLGLGVRVRG